MNRAVRALLMFAAAVLLALPVAAFAAEPTFPTLTGRVVDEANVIPADIEASLTAKLAALEASTTDQFVVVTLSSLQGYEIADYGFRLGRAWGIGQAGKDNGVLLIVAPNERAVRFEVGYGLEGELTDALTRVIIENAILPRFRADDIGGGIERGVDDAIQVIKGDAAEIQSLADQRDSDDSIWATILPFLIFLTIIVVINLVSRRRGWGWLAGTGAGSSWSSGGRSWGGGGSGSSGGGGFSGGGGSFGGGGSSGRW